MLTHQQRADIARRNGARSKGPKTEQGKLRACRNSLRHGRRATTLAPYLPPDSATLKNEDRQLFFALYDQNLAKYCPEDHAEKAVVREITELQWANHRIARARQSRLNLETAALGGDIHLGCEVAFSLKSMVALRHELNSNSRLITQAERRLKQLQNEWRATEAAEMTSADERTTVEPIQLIENTKEPEISNNQTIYINGPLTREYIAKYQKLFPGKDLTFTDAPQNQTM